MQLSRVSLDMDVEIEREDDGFLPRIYVNIPAQGLPCFSNLECLELKCTYDNTMIDFPSIARLLEACHFCANSRWRLFCFGFMKWIRRLGAVGIRTLAAHELGWEVSLSRVCRGGGDDRIQGQQRISKSKGV
ncbi:uncharacterized protein LOC110687214 [Chenopodium quinoa]|uniref:uncharacterized protein LOC110687214 n=1 Tax=Chenopodium quinoa TaxID=63459 RepID=UPI000B79751D|nr:uncharacterized protein LOC110687214 [Chenopodium quinoa]